MSNLKKQITIGIPKIIRNAMNLNAKTKNSAKEYNPLYHYTITSALKSIITSNEFWLKNLISLNDPAEYYIVDAMSFKNNCYIASFTSNSEPLEDMRKLYCDSKSNHDDEGIIISVRQEWFERKIHYIASGEKLDCPIICKRQDERKFIYTHHAYLIHKIASFGFYSVQYKKSAPKVVDSFTDEDGTVIGNMFFPEGIGITKAKRGADRDGTVRDWWKEQEVRLKVLIENPAGRNEPEKWDFPMTEQISVKLSNVAFEDFIIRFLSDFPSIDRKQYLDDLAKLLSDNKKCNFIINDVKQNTFHFTIVK